MAEDLPQADLQGYHLGMSAQTQPWLSPEQYLKIERASDIRHEYQNGRMFAMPGGTFNHTRITINLIVELSNDLIEKPFSIASGETRIRVEPTGPYTYADIAVVCGEPEFLDNQTDTLLNPELIIEVLSPSTEAYDRGDKAAHYKKLPSLKEYALVSQREPRIEIFRRQDPGEWLLCDVSGMENTCHFQSVNCRIALAKVYRRVEFTA